MDSNLTGCSDLDQMTWLFKVREHLIKKQIVDEEAVVDMKDYISYYLSMFPPYAVAKRLLQNKNNSK